jgi:DNA-binding CsgD family transcriptional regulator
MPARRAALKSLMALCHRGLVDPADAEELVMLYGKAFGFYGMAMGQAYGFNPWTTTRDIPPDWPEILMSFANEDPAVPSLRNAPIGTPFTVRTFSAKQAPPPALFDAFKRAGYHDCLVQRFTSVGGEEIFMGAYRRRGMPTVSDDDITLATLLYPHLAGALSTRSALYVLAGEKPMTCGHAYVTFPRLEIELDAKATSTLRRAFGARADGAEGGVRRRLERLVASLALEFYRGAPGARSHLIRPSLRAELAWVPARRGESCRALVLFFRDAQRCELTAAAAELLSPRMRDVAVLAANGATNLQIATALGMAPQTVQTHLREIFRRLDIARRGELAAFVRPTSRAAQEDA